MRLTRTPVGLVVATAAILGACINAGSDRTGAPGNDASPGSTRTSKGSTDAVESVELQVAEGEPTRSMWAFGDEVYGIADDPKKLEGAVHSPLAATYSPAAVPSPDDPRLLAYSSFHKKRPVVRVADLESGDDSIVDEGAYSIAWSEAESLAYFKGLTPRVRDPARYRGHVVVRDNVDAPGAAWSERAGRYIVSAWAGDSLIVHQLTKGWPNLVVFDGRGRERLLAKRAILVALSPDGTRAFIAREPDPRPAVSVIDVAGRREVARFAFSDEVEPIHDQRINYVAESGSWEGETVVAGVTGGLAVFAVSENEITLEKLLGVDTELFPVGLVEPQADETGRYVVAVAELMQRPRAALTRTALMQCDLVEHTCVLGRSAPSYQPPRPIYNPSRPQD